MAPVTPPVVILVRPQLGENIGAAARAMMNCGLTEMRLVAPRDGWPNPAALPMAAGGGSIIEAATVHATIAEAATQRDINIAQLREAKGVRSVQGSPLQ